mgnify:CR=1 FL=1
MLFRSDRRLRDLGRSLSRWRDADALAESVARLSALAEARLQPTLAVVKERTERRRNELRLRLSGEGIMARRAVLKGLADASQELSGWLPPKRAIKGIAKDLKKTYAKALLALAEAKADDHPATWHQLRIKSKRLAAHAKLLGKTWPELSSMNRDRLEEMTEILGHEQDLGLLDAFVAREPESWPPEEIGRAHV